MPSARPIPIDDEPSRGRFTAYFDTVTSGQLPDGAEPLYAQMRGLGYRRIGWLRQFCRYAWWRALLLPPLAYCTIQSCYYAANPGASYWLLGVKLGGSSALLFWTACMLVCFIGCGTSGAMMPSTFPLWVKRTAKRGFFRDLTMSRLDGGDLILTHFFATRPSLLCTISAFGLIGWSASFVSLIHNGGNDVLWRLVVAAQPLFAVAFLYHCESYNSTVRHGLSIVSQWRILLRVLSQGVAIALISVFISLWLEVISDGLVGRPRGRSSVLIPKEYTVSDAKRARQTVMMLPITLIGSLIVGHGLVAHALKTQHLRWHSLELEALTFESSQ